MLTNDQLNAALADLAEYGWVLLDSLEDTEQVQCAAPVPTDIVYSELTERMVWRVEKR